MGLENDRRILQRLASLTRKPSSASRLIWLWRNKPVGETFWGNILVFSRSKMLRHWSTVPLWSRILRLRLPVPDLSYSCPGKRSRSTGRVVKREDPSLSTVSSTSWMTGRHVTRPPSRQFPPSKRIIVSPSCPGWRLNVLLHRHSDGLHQILLLFENIGNLDQEWCSVIIPHWVYLLRKVNVVWHASGPICPLPFALDPPTFSSRLIVGSQEQFSRSSSLDTTSLGNPSDPSF